MNLSHTEVYRVHRYDVGRNMRLRPTRLCDYLEDAAGAHAEALGVGLGDLRALGLAWVLAKMRLDIDRLPGAGEDVRVRTRPIGIERLQFRRDFTVCVGDEEVARAVTQWVIFNPASRRLERIPLRVAALTPETPDPAMEDADIRPEDPAAGLSGPSFPVRLDDIDQNLHVNNVRFAGFVLEAAHTFLAEERNLRRLDLVFKAEGRFGDVIAARTTPGPNSGGLLHGLYRAEDNRELVRAATEWI